MKIKNITFPISLNSIQDTESDIIDAFIEIEENNTTYSYTVTIATPKNIAESLQEENINYFEPGYPYILVKKLTREIIEETIQAYVEENDGYWLRLYPFAPKIDKSVFDTWQAEHIQEFKEFDECKNSDEFKED